MSRTVKLKIQKQDSSATTAGEPLTDNPKLQSKIIQFLDSKVGGEDIITDFDFTDQEHVKCTIDVAAWRKSSKFPVQNPYDGGYAGRDTDEAYYYPAHFYTLLENVIGGTDVITDIDVHNPKEVVIRIDVDEWKKKSNYMKKKGPFDDIPEELVDGITNVLGGILGDSYVDDPQHHPRHGLDYYRWEVYDTDASQSAFIFIDKSQSGIFNLTMCPIFKKNSRPSSDGHMISCQISDINDGDEISTIIKTNMHVAKMYSGIYQDYALELEPSGEDTLGP